MLEKLNFPTYNFRFKNKENKIYIFDLVRKKFVLLQPEEWVRQHCLHFLIYDKTFPLSWLSVERQIKFNSLTKRYDIVAYDKDNTILLIVECKAPNIPISQKSFDQIAQYNMALNSKYLMVTNGISHYFATINYETERYLFLPELPQINL